MESGSKKHVLVTGASGMLGKALIRSMNGPYEITGVSRRATPGGVSCDLSDASQVQKLFDSRKFSLVIHSAAYSDVDGCERDPKQAHDSNVLAPKNLSKICGEKNIPWIHVSTDYVFYGDKRSPYTEEDRVFPKSIYGLTKLLGEYYAQHSASPSAIVRTSWLFGPENPKTFVNWVSARLKNDGAASVLDNQTTAPTSIKDLVQALEKMAECYLAAKEKKRNDVFHVCNRGGTTHLGMARFIGDTLGLKVRIERIDLSAFPNRPALRPKHSVMETDKFEKTFGMKMRSWQESLKEYVTDAAPCVS